ncbi:MAG: carboxypeptidase-like regulatory domain-containing protein [Nitrospirota bacterium]|nr:carboxypeptidase-like regulatory domain-containing protein [Nitrospirota bacterium]
MSVWNVFSAMALVVFLGASFVEAYEEIEVKNGGILSGVVTLEGTVPRPKGYNLVTLPDPVYCGRISTGTGWRLLQPFKVDDDGGFKDVVILLTDIKKGKTFEYTPPRIEAVDCRFNPYIVVVRDRDKVEVVNLDPVLHDIQAYETSKMGARVLFNVPLPMSKKITKQQLLKKVTVKNRAGKVIAQRIKMRKGRNIFVMQCGFHAFMESWGLAVDHPYYVLSSQDGRYAISDIPSGTYKVMVWHPLLSQEFDVTIESGKTTTLDVQFDAPKGRLYANEMEENPRFGLELLGDVTINPIVERQVP